MGSKICAHSQALPVLGRSGVSARGLEHRTRRGLLQGVPTSGYWTTLLHRRIRHRSFGEVLKKEEDIS